MMKTLGTAHYPGGTDPFEADAWLNNLEKNFNATRCPNDYKKDVAVYYLEKDADSWWQNVGRRYGRITPTWTDFRKEFERKYFPPEARDRMERQFMMLEQGKRSVREYEAEFTRLQRYVRYGSDNEEAMTRKFLRGLRPHIWSRLQVVEFHSLYEVVERAVNVEEGLEAERAAAPPKEFQSSNKGQTNGRGRGRGQGNNSDGPDAQTRSPRVCYNCDETGHIAMYCPNKKQTGNRREYITCFACGEKGHFASSCPHPNMSRQVQPAATQRIEPAPKRQAIAGRVYALDIDKPESSRPNKGPMTGTYGF